MIRSTVIVLLLALVFAPGVSAIQLGDSPTSQAWWAPVQDFGKWIQITVSRWFQGRDSSGSLGSHIVPDAGRGGKPPTQGEGENPDNRDPRRKP